VDVPGGTCRVTWQPTGEVHLRGPAVLVAEIDLDADWLATTTRGALARRAAGRDAARRSRF
jgi:diaminopimelate epimerase